MSSKNTAPGTLKIVPVTGKSPVSAEQEPLPVDAASDRPAREKGKSDYQELLQHSCDATIITDRKGIIVDANERATWCLDYELDTLCGRNVVDIISGAKKSLIAQLKKNLEKEKFILIEAYCTRSDRSVFPVEMAVSRLMPQDTHLCFFARDITERRRAEEASRREQGLLLSLMNTLPDYIYFKDRDSRFLRINEALVGYLNLSSPDEAIGKTDHDFFAAEHADKALADEKKILETGVPIVAKEEREVWPDGRESWVSTTKAPMRDARGNIVGTFGISRDITEHKQEEISRRALETRMQHADKLESLGMLASGIAHDFNNLLMGIMGHASLLLTSLPNESKDRSAVEQIEATALRASDLTKQLLSYSGRGSVSIETTDLSTLVREMASLMEVTISKNVSLKYDFSAAPPPIDADVTQIRQVIMNLIQNASDAIGDKSGRISVATGSVECDADYLAQASKEENLEWGLYTYVEVTDTGCGMSEEVKAKICDPFYTTKPTGRGLGMATVQGIIRGHKGFMSVYSEVGEGSRMRVHFPSSGKSAIVEQAEEAQGGGAWKGSGTALVVDDEDIIREVSSEMMRALGFKTISVSSGEEALALFKEKHEEIVIVLLDEVMSGISGEKVFEEIRSISPKTKVVLCSGYAKSDAIDDFEDLAGFIQKPFTLETLSEAVRVACEG